MGKLTLRKLGFLFFTTLGIGALSAFVLNLLTDIITTGRITAAGMVFGLVPGALYGAISQAGFFAYLMLNYIAIDIFKRKYWWNFVQLFILVIMVVDMAVFHAFFFPNFAADGSFLYLLAAILLLGLAGAGWKVKLTNRSAYIPTLFFLVVLTLLEAVPGLQQGSAWPAAVMVLTLLVCNLWQILRLHRLVKSSG